MAAAGGDLISVGTGIERSGEFDTFQGLFSRDHCLQLHFAHDDSPGINKNLDASCILGLGVVEIGPCSVA